MNDPFTNLLVDIIKQKKREGRALLIALIISLCLNCAEVVCFLYVQSQWQYEVTTTTTTEQKVDGEDNAIVNGDQYNDESQNRSTK